MTNRERFLEWYKQEFGDSEQARRARSLVWVGWQAACPEGWQCVPKRMDRGMMDAAIPNEECNFPNYGPQEEEMQARYVRALAAAPKP